MISEKFLGCFNLDGLLMSGLLADFFEHEIKTLQEKVWDCDLEATKKFYREKLSADFKNIDGEKRTNLHNNYNWFWYPYMGYSRHHHGRYEDIKVPEIYDGSYSTFLSSGSCKLADIKAIQTSSSSIYQADS